jgi:hypothetical protein
VVNVSLRDHLKFTCRRGAMKTGCCVGRGMWDVGCRLRLAYLGSLGTAISSLHNPLRSYFGNSVFYDKSTFGSGL